MRNCQVLFLIFLLIPSGVSATEPIPYNDFISITEKALDALDEVEIVFSSSESMKIEVKMAFNKLDTALKKYNRYVKTWPEGKQKEIAWAITEARLLYDMTLIEGLHGENHNKAKEAAQKARDLFLQYKKRK